MSTAALLWIAVVLLVVALTSWVIGVVAGRLMYGTSARWWSPLRRTLWPLLHTTLVRFGGFSLSHVGPEQFAGRITVSSRELDQLFTSLGFRRNPWAALKRRFGTMDVSEGSWVWRDSGRWYIPNWLAPMQLHITVFENRDGTFDVYAHWEDNYWVRPRAHLDGTNFDAPTGVRKAQGLLSSAGVIIARVGNPPRRGLDAKNAVK
ncbi:hypothetical protein HUG10_20480 (plasmid) [Halorarum halophilum]|uniref:Uncharacterized protein n=1 Tax=Halorarum halophilum TaxID=2743090 RepID=A0A7D5GEP0_9EURY|nr:hypothetical protein [Halobaculum halophilum]QLG29986.1 hypothetical protein HUG10_20480 [Halobaculum halophilum]